MGEEKWGAEGWRRERSGEEDRLGKATALCLCLALEGPVRGTRPEELARWGTETGELPLL